MAPQLATASMAAQTTRKQLFFGVFVILLVLPVDAQEPTLKKLDTDPCVPNTDTVQEFSSTIWLIHENYDYCFYNQTQVPTLRVHTTLVSNDTQDSDPLVFVSRSNSQVQTWQLPYQNHATKERFDSSRHTICRRPNTTVAVSDLDLVMLYMDVFTSSVEEVEYSLVFEPVENFTLSLTDNITFNLSFNEPQLYYFEFPEGSDTVRVIASANIDDEDVSKCAIVSIQNASCPVNDQLDNARSKGMYQTMTSSASLVITADKMVTGKEFFVVVVAANQDICEDRSEKGKRIKANKIIPYKPYEITLSIEKLHSINSYSFAIVLPLIVFLPLGILIVSFFFFTCAQCTFILFMRKNCLEIKCCQCLDKDRDSYQPIEEVSSDDQTDESTRVHFRGQTNPSYGAANLNVPSFVANIQGRPDSSLFATGVFRGLLTEKEGDLRLTDLTTRGYSDLERSYKVYGWNTITVGIFYALPAFQLVFSEQMVLNNNGDQDICYYNFKCSRPFGALSAFNNVWSNVGYFIMGLSFLAIVAIRNYRANKERRRDKQKFDNFGVPQFFGVYYAMGFALVMEAFMSSFYHICPSDNNFQFDTAFMFIVGGLLIVKMLQARHPDIQANAFVAFFCFAVVTFLTFIGIWEWSKPYWETKFTLAILALIGIVAFSISYYYFHDWRIGHVLESRTYQDFFKWFKSWCALCNSKEKAKKYLPKHPYRFVKSTILVLVNIGLGIVMALSGSGIATVVLSLFVANFMVLLILYVICKVWYREPITLMPVVFLVLLGICWGTSFYFYFNNVAQWEYSPANSRALNEECLVLKFYDNHDVWHFLSAAAMFFSFLFLFTLDDGTKHIEREKLHVF